jgi:hypothetical protein
LKGDDMKRLKLLVAAASVMAVFGGMSITASHAVPQVASKMIARTGAASSPIPYLQLAGGEWSQPRYRGAPWVLRGYGLKRDGGWVSPYVALGAGNAINADTYFYNSSPSYYAYDDYDVGYDAEAYARCSARFRSFDPDSGTYMGYDGDRHRCPYL